MPASTTTKKSHPRVSKSSARNSQRSLPEIPTNGRPKNEELGDHAEEKPNSDDVSAASDDNQKSTVEQPATNGVATPDSVGDSDVSATASDVGENDDDQQGNDGNEGEEENPRLTSLGIIKLAKAENTDFFQDQHGDAFGWISAMNNGACANDTQSDAKPATARHFECHRLRSKGFRARLLGLIRAKSKTTPLPADIKQATEILELNCHISKRKELANRHCVNENRILIDLGDDQWRMISVSTNGWKREEQPSPFFYRAQHQQSLPEPAADGKIEELFEFISAESEMEKLLIVSWVIAALCPWVPNPILLLVGPQGSAKTTQSRRIRSLLDPSVTPVLGDIEMSNLFLTFQNHAVPCFENVSRFSRRVSDMFCRAVTGNGVERRKLFTDSDQVLYSFRRPIIINGIDTPSTRPDFLDRCLIIHCRRMTKFRTLKELDQKFEKARPRLFRAMLDLLVKTLALHPTTPDAHEFRMADFAKFGRAVARALGKTPDDFDDAYRLNVKQQHFEILEDSPMVRLLKRFAGNHTNAKPWKGTADQLLESLKETARDTKDDTAKKDLPRSARWLSSRLGELSNALLMQQIVVKKLSRTNAKRLWEVYVNSADAVQRITEDLRNDEKGGGGNE